MRTCERGTSTRRGRAAVALALAGVVLTSVATWARADTVDVTVVNMAFSPETVTVEASVGEPETPAHVNWLVRDQGVEHTVSFDDQNTVAGSSGRLSAGQTYSVVFDQAGTYTYRCEIHPAMVGTVVVVGPRSTPGDEDDAGSGTNLALLVGGAGLVAATGAAAFLLVRRTRRPDGSQGPGPRPTRAGRS